MDNFLPKDYKTPDNSDYFKFKEGENPFRVLSSAIVGYEYFKEDNKPVRSKEPFKLTPDIKKGGKVKHFWAFVVWNYNSEKIQILELTQSTIQGAIKAYADNKQWGDPKEYDIIVSKIGEGLGTEYNITVNPKAEIAKEILTVYKMRTINLEALYIGDNPFEAVEDNQKLQPAYDEAKEEVSADIIS